MTADEVLRHHTLADLLSRTTATAAGCMEWTGSVRNNGYGRLCHKSVHRLVWIAIHGPLAETEHVLHKCDNPLCANPEHLFLGTHRDNMEDMARKGRVVTRRGEASPQARLRYDDVKEIKRLLRDGDRSVRSIADEFGVSPGAIYFIKIGKNWRDVNCDPAT